VVVELAIDVVPILGTFSHVPNMGTMEKTLHSNKDQKLREWLKEKRLEQNLTMRELGKRLERRHQFVGKVEAGDRRLDVYEYVQYCQALGVSEQEGLYLLGAKKSKK